MIEPNEEFIKDLIRVKIKEKFSQEMFILWYIIDREYLIEYIVTIIEITDREFTYGFIDSVLKSIIIEMPTPQANKVTRFLEELAVKMMNIKNTIKSTGEKSW